MADDKRTISPEAVKKAMANGGNPLSDYFHGRYRGAVVDTAAGALTGVAAAGLGVLGHTMRVLPHPLLKAAGWAVLAASTIKGTVGLMEAVDGPGRMAQAGRGKKMWEGTGLPAGPDLEKEVPGGLGPASPQPAGDGAYLNDAAQRKAESAPIQAPAPNAAPAAAQPSGDGQTAGYVATRRTASGTIQVQVGGYRTPGR